MTIGLARRHFLSALGAAATWPLAARAQSSDPVRSIGVLPTGYRQTDPEGQARVAAFVDTLGKLGWSDGRNVRLEVRWPNTERDQINAEVAALVETAPDILVISSNAALAARLKLDRRVPTVFVQISDPVGGGFVGSLSHPESNITGFQNFEPAVGGKWLGLLKDVAPATTRAGVIAYLDTTVHSEFLSAIEAVAPSLKLQVSAINIREGDDPDRGIAEFAATPNGGLIFLPHPRTIDRRVPLIEQAAKLRLPAIYPFRYFAASGGLMSYGFDQVEQWRGAATYVDRILRGAKPGDLPVQAPTRYDLVINLKTAKALGLAISPALLATAVEVIE
jgi:putative tryptophan/tyrosine transport system substrate-binding protein